MGQARDVAITVLGILLITILCFAVFGGSLWLVQFSAWYGLPTPVFLASLLSPFILAGCGSAIFVWSGQSRAAKTHMIYMRLLNEPIDVWRAVQAEKVGTDIYRVLGSAFREQEIWEFEPGSIVQVEMKRLQSADFPVAVAAHPPETK